MSLKTTASDADVARFVAAVEPQARREDCQTLLPLFAEATGMEPRLWDTMIGYGRYAYRYASGHSGEWFLTGFAPRKTALTLYIMPGFDGFAADLGKLGKHKLGKSCLYLKSLDGIDRPTLSAMIARSVELMKSRYEWSEQ